MSSNGSDGDRARDVERERVRAAVRVALLGEGDLPVEVGRYRIVARIGSGASGIVYTAHDTRLNRCLALKVIAPGTPDDGERRLLCARLQREAQALAKLSHPNVAQVYEVDRLDDGTAFVALELVSGSSLDQWCRAAVRSPAEIVDVMLGVGRGLGAAHEASLVHRDVKPANIVVVDGSAKLIDFGLVRAHEPQAGDAAEPLTETGAVIGTPAYMAPELLRGEPAGALSDQYSYCASFYEALFGWNKTEAMDMGERGIYQMYGKGEKTFGGMMTKPAEMPGPPAWLYYVTVADLDATVDQVKARGGQLLMGPMDVPGGDRIAQCMDPQGAAFALHEGKKE